METKWLEKYNELVKFVADHPEIKIRPTSVSMSGDEKAAFYSRFEEVRTQFVKDVLGDDLINYAVEITTKWKEELQSICIKMDLEGARLDVRLQPFMNDPVNALAKKIYDNLFNVFKGKSALEQFVESSKDVVREEYNYCVDLGYKRWIALRILDYLDGDALYCYPAPDENDIGEMDGVATIDRYDEMPIWAPTKTIAMPVAGFTSYLVSNLTVHSKRFNRYISVRCDHQDCRWISKERSKNQEWIDYNDIRYKYGLSDLWSDIYIYVADDLRDLTLCGDKKVLCRPHIIIDIETKEDWFNKKELRSAKRHTIINNPKVGTIIASRVPVDEEQINAAAMSQEAAVGFTRKHVAPEILHYDPSVDVVDGIVEPADVLTTEDVISNDIEVISGTALVNNAPERYSSSAVMDQENNAVAMAASLSPEAVQVVESGIEGNPQVDEAIAVEENPSLNIKVIHTGWDTTALDEVLTELITPIPPYPLANW